MAESGLIVQLAMQEYETGYNNQKGTKYVFSEDQGKRDSIIVVAQLSPEFTAASRVLVSQSRPDRRRAVGTWLWAMGLGKRLIDKVAQKINVSKTNIYKTKRGRSCGGTWAEVEAQN